MIRPVWTRRRPRGTPPGPAGLPLVGIAPEFQRDALGLYMNAARDHGDVVTLPLGPIDLYFINHPDLVRQIFVEKAHNYRKSDLFYKLKILVGEGLLTSEGAFWKRQRRLSQPSFNRPGIALLSEKMIESTSAMLDRWTAMGDGARLDVEGEMVKLTLSIVTSALFGADLERHGRRMSDTVEIVMREVVQRMRSPFDIPLSVPTPANRRLRRGLGELDDFIYSIIEERRRSKDAPRDLLAMWMEAKDEAGGAGMSDRQLRDEAVTMFIAGHETTAMLLTWVFYLLWLHPEWWRRVQSELDTVLGGRTPTVEDVPALRDLRLVIEETLRLYPPAWIVFRSPLGDDELGGYRIPRGASMVILPYTLHRRPDFWDDPDVFDPERFTDERSAGRHRFAYIPFGAGARMCIGRDFSLIEAHLIVAMVLQRFRLHVQPGYPVVPEPLASLHVKGGLPMTLRRRA